MYTGSALAYVANKDLSWETTTQWNLGLDLTLFKSLNFPVISISRKLLIF